ncbi:hypothetical protein P5P86_05185 [Nocardioides sp. BP30]|uniref:hypothetical protein n=1 Tax=Nocardioides sp. BP30 TaxID=3036374 RepID=UPI002469733E|nr:hypothetical protein [Nocardioides sp. BP30]WGL53218.1 hypothetical protein P5P86_05185 [Nocardioides sp. BP30]
MTTTPTPTKKTPPPVPPRKRANTQGPTSTPTLTPPVQGSSRPTTPPPPTPTMSTPPAPKRWRTENIGLQSISGGAPEDAGAPKTAIEELAEKHGAPETTYGRHSSSETTTENTYNADGIPNGVDKKTTKEASVGTLSESGHESMVVGSGGGVRTSKTETEALAGAQVKLEALARVSDEELKVAVEMLARAGAFGKASAEGSARYGKASVAGKAEAEGGAGVQAELKAEASIDRSKRIPQLAAAIEAGIKAGIWGSASAKGVAKLGPLAFMVAAKIEAWAGAQADFKAEVFANAAQGIGASLEAKAQAGAGVEGSVAGSVDLGPLGFDVSAEAAAFAGVQGKFEAGFRVSLTGIQAKFEASAFAGAKASIGGKAGIRIRGRKLVSIKGEIEVYAGVGGKAKGSFGMGGDWSKAGKGAGTYSESERKSSAYGAKDDDVKAPFEIDKDGTMKFGGALGAALGIGASVDLEAELDLAGIGEVIIVGITELGRSDDKKSLDRMGPDFKREDLPADHPMAKRMFKKGYEGVFPSFKAYAQTKAVKGNNGVKRDKVQTMLDEINPLLRPYFTYKETDKGMSQAAKDAFRGQVKEVEIEAGQIKKWVDESDTDVTDFKGRMKQEESWRKSRDKLRNAFAEYASKKETKGDHGVKREKVQAIIDKHWAELATVFGADAPELVKYAAELARMDKYFEAGSFGVDAQGKLLTTAKIDDAGSKNIKDEYKTSTAMRSMLGQLNDLESDLKSYLSQGMAKKKEFTGPGVVKIVATHAAKLKTNTPGLNDVIAHTVKSALGEAVDVVTTKDCKIETLTMASTNITRMQADAATEAVKKKVISSISAYLERKTGQGDHGVKKDGINKRLKEATGPISAALAGGARDAEIKAWVEEALAPVQGTVTVVNGQLSLDPVVPGMMEAKKRRKEDGKAILQGGAELDNVRRSMVMDKLRDPLTAYQQSHMRAVIASPGMKLDQAALQAIIDKAMKSVAKDVRGAVGDGAIHQAIVERFPMVDADRTRVENLQLTLVEQPGWGQKLANDRRNGTGKGAASAAITQEIRSAGIKLRRPDTLQRVVDKHAMRFKTEERDEGIKQAIEAGFDAGTIETLVVTDGKVKKFKLKGK